MTSLFRCLLINIKVSKQRNTETANSYFMFIEFVLACRGAFVIHL